MDNVNVHLYQSPFLYETRILRITKSLASTGIFDKIVVVAALRNTEMKENEKIDDVRAVWRVPSRFKRRGLISKILITIDWSIQSFIFSKKMNLSCVNAHALSVLPLAVLLKFVKGCKLIYDAHEIETETTETKGIRKTVSKFIEKILIRYVDEVALTSDGHAEWYRQQYDLNNVWVIRNCPYKRQSNELVGNIFRKKFNIPDKDLIFLYQGAIEKSRGAELLMRVFSKSPKDKHIVFMGFGSILNLLQEYEIKFPNIHYHPAVLPDELVNYTVCANVGIHMMDDSCINHLQALPNKPMEYMNAGIPAIVSDLPEMGKLIRSSGAGWVVSVGDESSLEVLIVSLASDEIMKKSHKAHIWENNNNWEQEEKILFSMYKNLGFIGN
jgi:glycosyltransferase involved in cell wall biosynthesis